MTLVARTEKTLLQTAQDIRDEMGVSVTPVAADITTEAGRAAALEACPQPDIVLNNAGGKLPGDFRDWGREEWIDVIDLMMLLPIMIMRAVVDGMMERGFSRIVNIVSRSVKSPQAELDLSNGARSGLVGFTAGLARQTVRHNVTINNLLPGIVDSDAQREHVEGLITDGGPSFDEIWAACAAGNPAGRYGRSEEIGAYFAFLCSAQADFVTGQSLLIDGGGYPGIY